MREAAVAPHPRLGVLLALPSWKTLVGRYGAEAGGPFGQAGKGFGLSPFWRTLKFRYRAPIVPNGG